MQMFAQVPSQNRTTCIHKMFLELLFLVRCVSLSMFVGRIQDQIDVSAVGIDRLSLGNE